MTASHLASLAGAALLAGLAGGAAPAAGQEPSPADTLERPGRAGADAEERDSARVPLPDASAIRPLGALTVRVLRSEADVLDLPFAIGVLEEEAFRAGERGIGLAEALRAVPGVTVHERRNFALGDRISVRGAGARSQFGVRGVRVLLDGIPLTMPDGQTALTNLDPAAVGRAEIVRGPAAALYGNAAGGVLAFHTREPETGRPRLSPRLLTGSHGLLETRAGAGGAADGLSWSLAGSRLEADGFRDHARATVWRTNGLLRARPNPEASLTAVFHLYHTPFAENPSSLSLEDARDRPRTARDFVVAQGAGETASQAQGGVAGEAPLPFGRLRVAAWAVRRAVWNPIPGRIIDLDRLAGGFRLELSGGAAPAAGSEPVPSARGAGRLAWAAGLEWERQRDVRRETENLGVPAGGGRAREGPTLLDQREAVLGIGPFAQLRLAAGRRLELVAAARYDLYRFAARDRRLEDGDDSGSRTMSRLSPALGLLFRAASGLSLYANVATAFQTPTTSELSNRPDGGGGFHPELGPERTASLELGAKGRLADPRLDFSVALYGARVSGALVPFEGPTEETFFRNAGASDRVGLELEAGWRPAETFELRAAYARQRYRFDEFVTEEGDFSGRAEPGVAPHRLRLAAVGRGPGPLRSELDLRWTAAHPVNDANTARNEGWTVVDLRISTRRAGPAGARPFLGVDNLFDRRYNGSVVPNAFGGRYYEPAPGRELYGGLSLSLGVRPGGR